MKIITRQEALSQGLSQYFTGSACKWGHTSSRQVVSGMCMECHRKRQSARNKEYHERTKNGGRTPSSRPRVMGRTSLKLEEVRNRSSNWRKLNSDKIKEQSHQHYLANKGDYFIKTYKRLGILKQRLFEHELEEIRRIYRECPKGYHVDHEIPINHPLVCGLHCVANLQYLTAQDNLSKSNHWLPDW